MTFSSPNLKPLDMGQLLDRAFRLYRNNFLLFVGIIALSQIPLGLINIASSLWTSGIDPAFFSNPSSETIAAFVAAAGGGFILLIITSLITQIGTAALTQAVADNYLGQQIGIIEAYQKIGRSWRSLVGALIVSGLLMIVIFIVFIIPCIGWIVAIPGVGFLVFFSLVVIPLIAPVIVIERVGAMNAISRAWGLARRRFWWVFGFVLIVTALAWFIIIGPTALVQLLAGSLVNSLGTTVALIIQQLISFLLRIIFLPLQLTCITLLYFDIRVRTEGFDLAMLTAVRDDASPNLSDIVAAAPAAQTNAGPTGTELGYFSLISIGAVAILFALGAIVGVIAAALGSTFGGL